MSPGEHGNPEVPAPSAAQDWFGFVDAGVESVPVAGCSRSRFIVSCASFLFSYLVIRFPHEFNLRITGRTAPPREEKAPKQKTPTRCKINFAVCADTFVVSSGSPMVSFTVWKGASSNEVSQKSRHIDVLNATGANTVFLTKTDVQIITPPLLATATLEVVPMIHPQNLTHVVSTFLRRQLGVCSSLSPIIVSAMIQSFLRPSSVSGIKIRVGIDIFGSALRLDAVRLT